MNKDVVVDGRRDHTSGDGINLQQHSKIECGVCEHHVFVGDTTAAKPGEAASCCAGEKIQGQAAHPGGLGFGAGQGDAMGGGINGPASTEAAVAHRRGRRAHLGAGDG